MKRLKFTYDKLVRTVIINAIKRQAKICEQRGDLSSWHPNLIGRCAKEHAPIIRRSFKIAGVEVRLRPRGKGHGHGTRLRTSPECAIYTHGCNARDALLKLGQPDLFRKNPHGWKEGF